VNGFGALTTALATVIFLISKFVDGAWVVVVAVPTFVLLFWRIHIYYDRAGLQLGVGSVPGKPERKPTLVIVPISSVSFLTSAPSPRPSSLGDEVGGDLGRHRWRRRRGTRRATAARSVGEWDPGVPLRVLHTEYLVGGRPDRRLHRPCP